MTKEQLIKRIMELDRYHVGYDLEERVHETGCWFDVGELLELIKESKE